jgi:hypothetical protein
MNACLLVTHVPWFMGCWKRRWRATHRCGGLRRIRRLKRTLPPAPAGGLLVLVRGGVFAAQIDMFFLEHRAGSHTGRGIQLLLRPTNSNNSKRLHMLH